MSGDWRYFMCTMGENLASIMVDVGISQKIKGAPRDLAILSQTYKHPDDRGLPTNEEFDAAVAIEKQIENFVAFGRDAYVGRITKEGERIFFIYTLREESRWQVLVDRLVAESGYEIELQMEHDPEHYNYWKYLYPTPDDWQVIGDMDVIESLKKSNDDPEADHKFEHWSYFPNEASARRFITWAQSDRFTYVAEESGPTDDGKHRVIVCHVGPTIQRNVSNHTIALRRKAEEFGGEYDGWETAAVRRSDPEVS
jgi:hypothetical protein